MTKDTLVFFPTPYPGEDFRSTIYRYHIQSVNREFMDSKAELFGLKSSKNQIFNRNMEHLVQKLPKESQLTTDYILNHHTVFPLYKPFMSPEKLEIYYQDVKFGNKGNSTFVGRLINATEPKLLSEKPKYCPNCMEDEQNTLGECFLHIEHQFHFLEVCPKHRVKLISACPTCGVPLSKPDAESITVSTKCIHGHEIYCSCEIFLNDIRNFQLIITEELLFFKNKAMDMSQKQLLERYFTILGSMGYIHNYTGKVLKTKLLQDMLNYYTNNEFLAVGITKDYITSRKTFLNLFNSESMHNHVILHILLMRFLSGCISNFFSINDGYSVSLPFGNGPWECFNPICPENSHPSISHCKRIYRSGILSGEFQCPTCGFTYLKRWHMEKGDTYTIKSFGHLWVTKMVELREKGYTQKTIAKKLGVNPLTVSKYLRKIKGMHFCKENSTIEQLEKIDVDLAVCEILSATREISTAVHNQEKVNAAREIISRLIFDNHSRKVIKLKALKEYDYLMKHDRQWMESNLPTRMNNKKIDCNRVDHELSMIIEQTAKQVYATDPPTRIRRYTIINALPEKYRNQFIGNRTKLPKCREILDRYEESKEEYQIRHVPKLVAQLMTSGYRNVTFNSIIAFRRSYRNCSDAVKQKIEAKLISMGMDIK